MPDVQEVFRMATQKVRPKPDFVERQHAQQRRRTQNRKIAAIGVVSAIGLMAALLVLSNLPGRDTTAPADDASGLLLPGISDQQAIEVSNGFIDAIGGFDGERAVGYLADGAHLGMDATTPAQVPLFTSFLEATGYKQMRGGPCQVGSTSALGTSVRCSFEWHAIRSGELGLGPYPGWWDITVRDGEIVSVSLHWSYARKFSSQVWEPFARWVSKNHPEDFGVMYVDDGQNFRLTEQSIRLWEERTKEYVEAVQQGAA
jgi:hypothetical protein